MTAHLIPSSGWGAGSGSRKLHQVHLDLVKQSVCNRTFTFGAVTLFDPDLQICAGDIQNGERDTCSVSDNYMWTNIKENKFMQFRFFKFDANYFFTLV